MRLERFPSALFDQNGYVLFQTEEDFLKCPHLAIKQKVHMRKRGDTIKNIPGYRKMKS